MNNNNKVREQQIPMPVVYPITISSDYKFIRTDFFYRLYSAIASFIFVSVIGYLFFSIIGKHKIYGRNKLKVFNKKGFITVANHCHLFDTILTGKVFYPRLAWYASVQRNFEAPYYRKMFRMLRGFPIPNGNMGLRKLIKPVTKAINEGKIVHFFPEAELWHLYQNIDYFQRGAFYLSHISNCPVVPIIHLFKPRKFFGKQISKNILTIKTIVGDPIYPDVPAKEGESINMNSVTKMSNKVQKWMKDEMFKYHNNK